MLNMELSDWESSQLEEPLLDVEQFIAGTNVRTIYPAAA
jgi:hypothetical protein